jgi:hypothetical protein
MAKEIVSKTLISTVPALAIVKAFRIANKRAGEAKHAIMGLPDIDDDVTNTERERLTNIYKGYCEKLKELATKSEILEPESERFHIWVNYSGTTGHTYPKDYKISGVNDNNYERHLHEIEQMQAAVSNELGGEVTGEDDDLGDTNDGNDDFLN